MKASGTPERMNHETFNFRVPIILRHCHAYRDIDRLCDINVTRQINPFAGGVESRHVVRN
jgi:hypothetical protein